MMTKVSRCHHGHMEVWKNRTSGLKVSIFSSHIKAEWKNVGTTVTISPYMLITRYTPLTCKDQLAEWAVDKRWGRTERHNLWNCKVWICGSILVSLVSSILKKWEMRKVDGQTDKTQQAEWQTIAITHLRHLLVDIVTIKVHLLLNKCKLYYLKVRFWYYYTLFASEVNGSLNYDKVTAVKIMRKILFKHADTIKKVIFRQTVKKTKKTNFVRIIISSSKLSFGITVNNILPGLDKRASLRLLFPVCYSLMAHSISKI